MQFIITKHYGADLTMQKEDAKTLLTAIYNDLLKQLESENAETVNESLFIDFLHDIANNIITQGFNPDYISSYDLHSFEEEYKLLAKESIDSYISTNNTFSTLSDEQQVILDDSEIISQPAQDLAARFSSVQDHLSSEVARANSTISELVERVKELENKSAIDPLTKVYNRRALDQYLHEAFSNISQNADSFHLMMIDVDDFKKINDSYGHLTGDKVLIYLANMLKKTLRDGDKVFRYGGEEFIIILNRIDNETCDVVAERILKLPRHSKLIFKDKQIAMTLSIGVTTMKSDDSIETLIERADKALYYAKKNGKNQIKVDH